jgi:hypothetical protein
MTSPTPCGKNPDRRDDSKILQKEVRHQRHLGKDEIEQLEKLLEALEYLTISLTENCRQRRLAKK